MRTKNFAQLVSILFALATFVVASLASAQTVTVNPGLVRKNADGTTAPERNNNLKITDINQNDCVADRSYDIPLTLAGFDQTVNLQVWAGAQDCSPLPSRTASTQVCWRVFDGSIPRQQSATPNVKVRDILAVNKTKGDTYVGPSSVDVCANKDQQIISLYFIWVKGDGTSVGSGTQAFNVDTVGSAPPTAVTATSGDKAIIVSWTPITEQSDTDGYNVYCDSSGNGTTDAGTTDATAADAAAGVDADAAMDAGTDAGVASIDSGTASSRDAGSDPGVCGGTLLVPGQQAPASLTPCATVSSAASRNARVKDLSNGKFYRFAVAAVDKYGNPGVLSSVTCETPADVVDFFETYRESGGQGGNCSMHASDAPSTVLLGSFAGLFVFRLVRRKRASKDLG